MDNKNTAKFKKSVEILRQAYARWMEGNASEDDMKVVEFDLRRFCRADVSSFNPDSRAHALLEGRREVWLRIHQFSTLTTDQIISIRKLENTPQ